MPQVEIVERSIFQVSWKRAQTVTAAWKYTWQILRIGSSPPARASPSPPARASPSPPARASPSPPARASPSPPARASPSPPVRVNLSLPVKAASKQMMVLLKALL